MTEFRRAYSYDLDRLYEIECASFTPEIRNTKKEIQAGIIKNEIYVITECDEVDYNVVVGSIWLMRKKKTCYIESVAVDDRYRNSGRGKELIENALTLLKEDGIIEVSLYVDMLAKNTIEMYKKLGFVKCDFVNDFYGKHKHAYFMEKRQLV
jgi:ribosomal protein S18 acetylase RimI-like enzyme